MRSDRQLAEDAVRLGAGTKHHVAGSDYMYAPPDSLRQFDASDFVRDWRVVGWILDNHFEYCCESVFENVEPEFSRPRMWLLSAVTILESEDETADHDEQG